jgi:hypothetical protein
MDSEFLIRDDAPAEVKANTARLPGVALVPAGLMSLTARGSLR